MVKKPGESSKSKIGGTTTFASSNWMALQKTIKKKPSRDDDEAANGRPKKRRKLDEQSRTRSTRSQSPTPSTSYTQTTRPDKDSRKNGESIPALRDMILGKIDPSESQKQPGKYLALDCEMVGIGLDGTESSLARVSIVNFHGIVLLDSFVKQKERVVDYRTQWSGVRERDMVKAKPFEEIQKEVAGLLKDRILVGHAVFNDLKALLLSHPRHLTRDTQTLAYKHKSTKSKYIALRNLVRQELDVGIQGGEHSSVTDARATMAVFRLNRRVWDAGFKQGVTMAVATSEATTAIGVAGKRKRVDAGEGEGDEELDEGERPAPTTTTKISTKKTKQTKEYPGGGRKGISSGLSVIVRGGKGSVPGRAKITGARGGKAGAPAGTGGKTKWWKELVTTSSKGGEKMTMGT